MDNILVRLKPELQNAIKKILKFANNRFHVIAAESGSELKKIGISELSSVQLGIYSAKKLEIGHALISDWVSKSNLSKNIKYQNGVLFLDVEQSEAEANLDNLLEMLRESDDNLTKSTFEFSNKYTIELDSDELGTIGTEFINDEIENETDENETE